MYNELNNSYIGSNHTSEEQPIIEVKHLHKHFGDKVVLDDVSFSIYDKNSVVILGASGTGKSVLFKCILGLLNPSRGLILINGQRANGLPEKERMELNKSISMVFQGCALFDSYTVQENILFGLMQKQKLSKREQLFVATEAVERVGLDSSVLNLYPPDLSGGMQKRVAFARAVTKKPKIIFFDEPTTGLDPVSSTIINNLISSICKDLKITTITITHQVQSVYSIASHVIFLNKSKIEWQGTVEEFKNNSTNSALYSFINGIPPEGTAVHNF